MSELVSVKRNPSEEAAEENFARVTRKFRNVIEKFKNTVYENLETGRGLQKHNYEHLDDAVNKIIQLGNILSMYLLPQKPLEGMDDATRESVASIHDLFVSHGVNFDRLTDTERDQCFQIVKTDIQWFPYAIQGNHIESLKRN